MTQDVYLIWKSMRKRCSNPNDPAFARYGGRGISVCPAWDSYAVFASDMGPRPDGFSIERKNNSGNYEPGNCVWASSVDQNNNRCNNHIVEWRGERLTLAQAIRKSGVRITGSALSARLRSGWDLERALTQPTMKPSEIVRRSANAAKTHCPAGHEYNSTNTRIIVTSGAPQRLCRACESARKKAKRLSGQAMQEAV